MKENGTTKGKRIATKRPTARTDKISISLTPDMAKWVRRVAADRKASISFLVRESLLPSFKTANKKVRTT